MESLNNFIPNNGIGYIKKWLHNHACNIKITKNRQSKLGDYRLMPNKSHQITINGNLDPELFFFVFTHEIAHLLAYYNNKNISPHGIEWKMIFQKMIIESISVYSKELQDLLIKFSKNPKANYMSSPDLVKYFDSKNNDDNTYIENIPIGESFLYKTHIYIVEEKKKKHYLCKNIKTGKLYLFKSCAKVEQINKFS